GLAASRTRLRPRGGARVGHRGQHLAHGPAEAAFEDLLHGAEEVGRRLVVVLARAGHRPATDQVPLDQDANVERDVALALTELRSDLVERERLRREIEQPEDPRLLLGEDSRGGGRRPEPVDERAGDPIHAQAAAERGAADPLRARRSRRHSDARIPSGPTTRAAITYAPPCSKRCPCTARSPQAVATPSGSAG